MTTNQTSNALLVTVDEAAQLLGIGRTTIYELIHDGTLTPIKLRRCVRFSITELESLASPAAHR